MLPQQCAAAPTTIFAPASRGACPRTATTVTSTPGCRCPPQLGHARHPVHQAPPARRGTGGGAAASVAPHGCAARRGPRRTAQYTASGVDGQPRSTQWPGGPNAATASRSASRTLKASISGGSPTALDPYTAPSSVRPLEQRDPELLGHLREARQLVRAGRLGGQPAAGRPVAGVPAQVLQGQPARALHEPALDLAEVDQRGEAVADVVHDVDPAQPVGPGEPVDLDLAGRDPVREVLERLALHPLGVPVQPGGAVEAGRPQLHPPEVGHVHQLGERSSARRVGRGR